MQLMKGGLQMTARHDTAPAATPLTHGSGYTNLSYSTHGIIPAGYMYKRLIPDPPCSCQSNLSVCHSGADHH